MQKFDDRFFEEKKLESLRAEEEEGLMRSLSNQYGYRYVNLRGISIDPSALTLVSEEEARAGEVAPFERKNKKLSVAIRNPNNPATKDVLSKLQNTHQVTIFMCSQGSLEHAWERYHDQTQTTVVKKGVLDIDPDEIERMQKTLTSQEAVSEAVLNIRGLNSARRVTATLEVLFAGAFGLGASDIHVEPEESVVRIRYRLDGVLHDVVDLERKIYDRLNSRIKLLAGVKINIHDEAQDGRFTFTIGEKDIEIRTSVIPGSTGESFVMRLLDPTVASFNMDQLGLNPAMYELMTNELKRPNGMIITTGPTGSGKTTALYAFLRKAHRPEVKIITIEDPVEYKVGEIVQTQVGDDYTFASGLRSILRQDPDIIMVGEIRDEEVAETAVHAAQTGHLVFSTLHTNSAVGAFPRLIDLGVDARMIGSSVNVMLGQRLVRVLCEHCKESYTASTEEQEIVVKVLASHPAKPVLPSPLILHKAAGCEKCGDTGYAGRQGVFEAIKVTKEVEETVIRDPREHVILESARAQGIPTMPEDGMEKVLKGMTSLTELQRVVDLTRLRGEMPQEAVSDEEFESHVV